MEHHHTLPIAIIGAGPLGLAVARELKQQGIDHFCILEASDDVGGTWHLHSYPGLACDVWAHSYTFSWARNPDWSASFVHQPEIEAYLQKTARDAGLMKYVRLNSRVTAMHYQPEGYWQVRVEGAEPEHFSHVISCIGNQFTPLLPNVPGMDSFQGPSWHSTHWKHDIDLSGKKVAVVGSAAAAVQIVPELAKTVAHLTVLQRSANWIMPRNRRPYSRFQRWLFRQFPALNRALVTVQSTLMKMVHEATSLGHKRMDQFENIARKYIAKAIKDPELQKKVTPTDRYGCKRPLVSDDFYPALNRDNVTLQATGLKEVTPTGLITAAGDVIDVDAIIYCTGYRVLDFDRIDVRGRDGQNLAENMAKAPEAYKGMAVPGFPNYFFGMGPNGVSLLVSYFVSAELNARAIARIIREQLEQGLATIEVKEALCQQYNQGLLQHFPRYAWGSPSCNTYYQSPTGHIPFLFPGNFKDYENERLSFSLQDFESLV